MNQKILIDSGFWYALYDSRDQFNTVANDLFYVIEKYEMLIPWPTLYETLNTRFVKRKEWFTSFENLLNQVNVHKISDATYRNVAINTINKFVRINQNYSLVDLVIRGMLEDVNLDIDVLVTFNPSDFHSVCSKRNIEILNAFQETQP